MAKPLTATAANRAKRSTSKTVTPKKPSKLQVKSKIKAGGNINSL